MNKLKRKATPWVSYFVLIGCVAITVVLVCAAKDAQTLAEAWVSY